MLGIEHGDLVTRYRDIFDRLVVAQVNDGRLPVMRESQAQVMTKRGEDVHAETVASMLKEVTVKKRVGGSGYHGVSIPLGKGFRYYTGGARGHSVTGKEIQIADNGVLSVTSKRIVFMGNGGTTLEVPYSRLLNLTAFQDGIQFHVSNRKNAPLFQLEHVDPIAALIGATAERAQVS
jgi:hypothetical protein